MRCDDGTHTHTSVREFQCSVCADSASMPSGARAGLQQRITYWLCSGIDLESGSFMTCPRETARGIRDLPRAPTQV